MKICPFCAEEIQDAAIVCKHCGRELESLSTKEAADKYEYLDFEYVWPESNRKWKYYRVGEEVNCRTNVWHEYQNKILPMMEERLNQGWEYLGELGPECITLKFLSASQTAELFLYGRPSGVWPGKKLDPINVSNLLTNGCLFAILAVITGGLAIGLYLVLWIFYRAYTPERFSKQLRRKV